MVQLAVQNEKLVFILLSGHSDLILEQNTLRNLAMHCSSVSPCPLGLQVIHGHLGVGVLHDIVFVKRISDLSSRR